MLYLTGIHHVRQLAGFDPAAWPGIRRRIAIDLVEDIDALADTAVREALFERIVDARGAFKRTYRDRFAAFDQRLGAAWQDRRPVEGTSHVLDVAVSDGSTSLALIDAVESWSGGDFRFTATDLDGRYLRLWRRSQPDRRVIVTEAGGIVQIVLPPFLFTHRESRFLFPVNRLARPAAQRFAGRLVADWKAGAGGVDSREILLVNPELRRRLATDQRLSFRAWDVLEPWPGPQAHCVRAMNVLNPGYFDDAQMTRAVGHLVEALAEGGLLAIGSNEDAGTEVDGVICRRINGRLVILATAGRGFRAGSALEPFLATDG